MVLLLVHIEYCFMYVINNSYLYLEYFFGFANMVSQKNEINLTFAKTSMFREVDSSHNSLSIGTQWSLKDYHEMNKLKDIFPL